MASRILGFAALLSCLSGGPLATSPLLAQPPPLPPSPRYAFQTLGEDQGLETKTVVALHQDARGFLWIGTQDGLLRYDGGAFTLFDRKEGLPDGSVSSIFESKDGTLWAVTQTGLARFDGQGFQAVRLPGEIALRPQPAALDPLDRLHVLTSAGVVRLDGSGGTPRIWNAFPGLDAPVLEAVHVTPGGSVLVAAGRQLFVLREDAFVRDESFSLPFDENVVAILTDGDGTLWVRTPGHLLRRDRDAPSFVLDDRDLPNAADFGTPALDRSGRLLVPTVLGLHAKSWGPPGPRIPGVSAPWIRVGKGQGLRSNAVAAVTEDREGALWIGYGGAGVDRWPGRRAWSAWSTGEGLPDEVVWCTARDRKRRLWVGTNDGLAVLGEDGRFRAFNEKDGLAGRTVRSLALASDGSICAWSVPGGLTRVAPERMELSRLTTAVPGGMPIVSIGAAPDGTLWGGSRRGLYRVSLTPGVAPVPIELPPGLQGATTIVNVAPDGTLWTSGRAGLVRYDGTSFRHFTARDGLRADAVGPTAPVNAREVWVTYRESVGVSRLAVEGDRVVVTHHDRKSGLVSDNVYLIGVDALSRVYVGSDVGISVIEHGIARTLDRWDGLIWNDCSGDAFALEDDGAVLIGTSRGLARFDPQAVQAPRPPPPVLLTSARLGAEDRLFDRQTAPEVPFTDRSLLVRFAGLTFRNPAEVRFRYRLVGLESEMTETAAREARYPGLAPGSYRFEVTCRSADGQLSAAPAIFAFTVLPPWWQTWPFRLLVILALLGVGTVAYRLRVRHLVRMQKHLEGLVSTRTQLLNQRNAELQGALAKLSDAQKQILLLSTKSKGRLDDLAEWTRETAREVASLVGVPSLDVVVLDGERVRSLAGGAAALPSAVVLEGAKGPTEGEDGKSTLLPILGPTGQPRGALVVPVPAQDLGEMERQLLESFASHLGATLDLSKMRDRLTRAESERARSVRDLSELGIDTVRICPRCRRCYDQKTETCQVDGAPLQGERLLPLVVGERYRLTRLLGEGGMGSVFRGTDDRLKGEVAIKIILAEHLNDPLVRSRFEREARIMSQIRHPGLVGLLAQGELPDGSVYLVMELLEGMDLAQLLDLHGPGTPRQVAEVLLQVGDALTAAHAAGVVHRDLKPANLFLVRSPSGGLQAKVVDFGLAKATGEMAGTKATKTGFIVGSPAYMSPEQVREEPVDGRSDLFSLASVVYELLTGIAAFRGASTADVLTKVLQKDPPPLATWIKDLPPRLEKDFFLAFEKNPELRPPTAMAWVERIVPQIEALQGSSSVTGWPTKLTSRG